MSDWVATFTDSTEAGERLAIMVENADPYEPPRKKTIEDIILSADQFSSIELPAKKNFLHPWLKENSINLISGWRGTGKTWMALGIANAVSKGETFGPWEAETSCPCLFVDGEMPTQDIIERLNSLGISSNSGAPLYIYSDAYANQFGLTRAHLANDIWRIKLKSILMTRKIRLLFLDNLASLASGIDENSKKDWDPINSWLLELRFAGIATIMNHHVNKDGGQRGTSAREDNLDISILLKHPRDYTPEDGARFIAHFTKSRVSTKDLQLISDTEFKLIQDESGQHNWTLGNVKKERKREILKMLDEEIDYKSICDNLGVTKGYISQVKKKAVEDGHLTTKGKLTQSGFLAISEG
ncbi:MAG: AAA family ATPase [Deltaproteobacteria bacterium]|nr:AAA family ATPase [Deltaproteobacteria bacterium]